MRRKRFDAMVSLVGLGLSIFLFVAAGLLNWGYSFADNTVKSQLAAQNIYFPEKGSPGFDAETFPDLQQYGGMQMTTGKQAQTYADHYIAEHLNKIAGGKTYSEVSTLSRANPTDAALAGQVQTLFRGESLRGTLLTAFAFWQLGQIAKLSSYAALLAGGLMLFMTILGYRHLRRTPEEATI
ncbi:MAG: hypothetical protein F2657_04130 [Actinobacteria bacterium]|uniref:Unannotated protein n=1 Tax=freshwater metagenome TaxID=449393 RepID=A0A6J6NEP8_9ZZZZ|nr:hypothetical protein [Actinomycetota bacterium]